MLLSKLTILLSALTAQLCQSDFAIETPKDDNLSSLVDATVNVVKFCYANRVDTVGLAGDSPDLLIVKLSSVLGLSLTLVDQTKREIRNRSVERPLRYQLQIFVITASSVERLKEIIIDINNSLWWNHMATFFILDWSSKSDYACSKPLEMLKTAWEMDMLHAKLICIHPTEGLLIHGYNPYTGKASNPWQLADTSTSESGHPWTLFLREYRNDEKICDHLDFDKTTDLDGHGIRATVKTLVAGIWHLIPNKTGVESFGGITGHLTRILFNALNATPILLIHEDLLGYADEVEGLGDISIETINGTSDIGVNLRPQFTVTDLTTTYPRWTGDIAVITRYSGYASQVGSIESAIDSISRYGLCLVLLITLVYFKWLPGQNLMLAILNTLRVICNGPIWRLPSSSSSRIYFTGLFMFMMIIQSVYQGKLSALLAKPVALPNINTMQDLAVSGHTIYGFKDHARFFDDPVFDKRYVELDDLNCTQYVLDDDSAACVDFRRILISDALEFNLHVSSESLFSTPFVYIIRPDWPLEQRVNEILGTMVESDIIAYPDKEYSKAESIIEMISAANEDTDTVSVIGLSELKFAFAILGYGLACATIVFIVEIAIG